MFRSNAQGRGTVSEADIARVIADDVRDPEDPGACLRARAYVLPADVNALMVPGATRPGPISTATVDYATFAPGLTMTDAEISKFFSDNSFRYTIPPRFRSIMSSSRPRPTGAGPAPRTARSREYYDSRTRASSPSPRRQGPGAKPNPLADLRRGQAPGPHGAGRRQGQAQRAIKAGSDLAFELFDGKVTRGLPSTRSSPPAS
jgi:peptidyl-prolyl cis-trans isomerase D